MSGPYIKVVLHDGVDANTWVTFVPIDQPDALGAQLAVGKAFALFVANLGRDSAVLTERLKTPRLENCAA